MVMKSGLVVLLLFMTAGGGAAAGERPMHRFSCTLVRFYVAKYSLPAAESWARNQGASEAEIDVARRCLGSSVQTASFTPQK